MTEKNGILTFECDKDERGQEILNSTQRNNKIVYPDPEVYPKAQYIVNWKNTCNVTSMVMAGQYAGAKFPGGKYEQDEDNLAYFILTNKEILEKYKGSQPVLYNAWIKTFTGKATKTDLNNAYPPTELHDYLSMGTNLFLGYKATQFSTNINFKKTLWDNMVNDNLPIVVSTTFGGMGHIVCVTGVQYKKADFESIKAAESIKSGNIEQLINSIDPISIIIDDPYGKYNPETNKYDAPNQGNDICIPWNIVISRVKPVNSKLTKWCHTFNHGMATV